jgi:hypothetical protein
MLKMDGYDAKREKARLGAYGHDINPAAGALQWNLKDESCSQTALRNFLEEMAKHIS